MIRIPTSIAIRTLRSANAILSQRGLVNSLAIVFCQWLESHSSALILFGRDTLSNVGVSLAFNGDCWTRLPSWPLQASGSAMGVGVVGVDSHGICWIANSDTGDILRYDWKTGAGVWLGLSLGASNGVSFALVNDVIYALGCDVSRVAIYAADVSAPSPQWRKVSQRLSLSRSTSSVIVYQNRIYMFGGFVFDPADADIHKNVEVFDPQAGRAWTHHPKTSPYQFGEASACGAGNCAYFASGENSCYTTDFRQYSFVQRDWKRCAPLSLDRVGAGMSAFEGRVFICGGYNCTVGALHLVESYDAGTDTWRVEKSLPLKLFGVSAVVLNVNC
eukprot:TRINITY_DN15840_c0_g1_i1.p1 TRINITY_DN15840_c0_g1~~TRINITY_DN15840_c0_g1_i1.p1  ORF type:complete len:331 (+),score=32.66 TRINITY_DN15840_c0_g1_i1:111-1103(+)